MVIATDGCKLQVQLVQLVQHRAQPHTQRPVTVNGLGAAQPASSSSPTPHPSAARAATHSRRMVAATATTLVRRLL